MAAITADDIADLITGTLQRLNRGEMTVNATDLQDYTVMGMMNKSKMLKKSSGGTHFRLNYMYNRGSTARWVSLFYEQSAGTQDYLTKGQIPWAYGSYHIDWETREMAMNMGDTEQIIDLIKMRRLAEDYGWYELMEESFWTKPADSTDELTPMGMPMFVVQASGTPSLQGGNPSGFTGGYAGIDASTYTRWQNWTGDYTAITVADLIDKMATAMYKCDFKVPAALSTKSHEGRNGVEIFTTFDVVNALAKIAEGRNDNLGPALRQYENSITMKGAAISPVPYLDQNTSNNPVYGLNWGTIGHCKMRGQWGVEQKTKPLPNQPTTVRTNLDFAGNWFCVDRRKNWVLQQA